MILLNNFPFRVMAVSAPNWARNRVSHPTKSLDSRTPFSIQNAVRVAAHEAQHFPGVWGVSNWSRSTELRKSVFMLTHYEDQLPQFQDMLLKVRPHLLLIGAMTLSFPGAVGLAQSAKNLLGDQVFIVLGGKHCNETLFEAKGRIKHHRASPLRLMQAGRLPPVFDLVVSGEGEMVIRDIGRIIGDLVLHQHPLAEFYAHIAHFRKTAGRWVMGWLAEGEIHHRCHARLPMNYDHLPIPAQLFGVHANFPIFKTEFTGHAFSDMGPGCIYNCFFCSERSQVNGKVRRKETAAQRQYRQLKTILTTCETENQTTNVSAFIEDSVMLMGQPQAFQGLYDLLNEQELPIVFGGQLTVDNLLNPVLQDAIAQLQERGLRYIYTGVESNNESISQSFSKNTQKKTLWSQRNDHAIEFLTSRGLDYGVSILFGLGESSTDRWQFLKKIQQWQTNYGNPRVVSMNWATQHPLLNQGEYDYIDWGTPADSPYLPLFQEVFGEASVLYGLPHVSLPEVNEIQELRDVFRELQIQV